MSGPAKYFNRVSHDGTGAAVDTDTDGSHHPHPPIETSPTTANNSYGGGLPGLTATGKPKLRFLGSTLSSNDSDDGSLTFIVPQDDEPLRRFVNRSISFDQEDFANLLSDTKEGVYRVSEEAEGDQRYFTSNFRPENVLERFRQGRSRGQRHGTQKDKQHRSICKLKTFRPDSKYYMIWSAIILILDMTYSAFVVPISLGMMTSYYSFNWTSILDYGVGPFFVADFILSFHVGFIATYNIRKVLVLNGRLIAKYYLSRGSCIVDFLSALAWVVQIILLIAYNAIPDFDPSAGFVIMEVLRLFRLVRVGILVKRLLSQSLFSSVQIQSKYLKILGDQNVTYLLCISYLLLVLINLLGCIWNFIAAVQGFTNSWINFYTPFINSYGDGTGGPLTKEECENVNDVWLWLAGVYWAITTIATVGYGDILPANAGEMVFVVAVECLGVMFFGLLISTIGELMAQVNKRAQKMTIFRTKLASVDNWVNANKLPNRLQKRIKTYYAEVWLRHSESKEETELFKELPHVLRNEVAWSVLNPVFAKMDFFQGLDHKSLYLLASRMTPYRYGPGHELAAEGDAAERMWVLVEGEILALWHYDKADQIEAPAVVGDAVILSQVEGHFGTYPCTYRTITSCMLWSIRWKDLEMFIRHKPILAEHLSARAMDNVTVHVEHHPDVWQGAVFKSQHLRDIFHYAEQSSAEQSQHHGGGGGGGWGGGRMEGRRETTDEFTFDDDMDTTNGVDDSPEIEVEEGGENDDAVPSSVVIVHHNKNGGSRLRRTSSPSMTEDNDEYNDDHDHEQE